MSYYSEVYLKRLNRFGNDLQSRIVGQREKAFEDLLQTSTYRVDFTYNNVVHPGLLEKYKQDESQTLQYLLTRTSLNLSGGDLLSITDELGRTNTWLVYWLEYIEASGYHRYVVIKTNYALHWIHNLGKSDEASYDSLCYFFGKKKARLYDNGVEHGGLYLEDTNTFNLIMPFNKNVFKEDYFEITKDGRVYPFRISGYDVISTPGIVFVTAIPVYEYNKEPDPVPDVTSKDDAGYNWFTGDFKEV